MENDTPITVPPIPNGDAPKKFIRTLARDIDTFQKGGIPDLAPFEEPQPTPEERLIEASPVAEAVLIPPLPPLTPATPLRPAEAEPMPAPLETYSQDFKDRVKETNASTAAVLAAEQDAAPEPGSIPQEPARNVINILSVVSGIALLAAGAAGIYLTYSRYLAATVPVILAPAVSTPIFVDASEQVSGSGAVLQQAIAQSARKPLAINTVRLLVFATSTDISVFAALAPRAPGILLRNIDTGGSMAGIVHTTSGESPFFILSVGSYAATFSGMLSWEPLMQSDLATIFPLYQESAVASTTATSTLPLASRAAVQKGNFNDEAVNNHDVRVYRDADGRSVMLYGYWDEETLVIARDSAAFAEILARLATSHTK